MEKRTKTEYAVIRWYNDCEALVLFTGWEPFMHSPMQRKYAAKAAHGAPSFPYSIAKNISLTNTLYMSIINYTKV